MSALDLVADELAIRSLVARYIDAVYRRDKEDWAATWAEESRWSVLGTVVTGKEQVVAVWLQAMDRFPFVAMQMHSGTLDMNGAVASGRWYLSEYLIDQKGTRQMIIGIYSDQYIKEGGQWLFQERRYDIMYQGPPDLSGDIAPYPADL